MSATGFLATAGLRFAVRGGRPVAIALVTLALGIAVSVTIFGVANGVLFEPLPFRDASRLFFAWSSTPSVSESSVSLPDFRDWHAAVARQASLGAFKQDQLNLEGDGPPERLPAAIVSSNLFDVLGVQPALGRGFEPGDDVLGQGRLVILSDELWERRYRRDRSILGRSLNVDGRTFTVVGIMPPRFQVPLAEAQLWTPIGPWSKSQKLEQRGTRAGLYVIGRLAPGAELRNVTRDLESVAAALAEQYPRENSGHTVRTAGLQEKLVGGLRGALFLLLAAGLGLFAIACANASMLLLARMSARRHEFALKMGIGATPRMLVSEVLAECAFLSAAAALLALLASYVVLEAVKRSSLDIPRLASLSLDLDVIAAAAVLAALAVVAAGLIPALRVARKQDVTIMLNQSRTEGAASNKPYRGRGLLVVVQFTLAAMLLTGAALLGRSLMRFAAADPGFAISGRTTVELALPIGRYYNAIEQVTFFTELTRRFAARGLHDAAVVSPVPMGGTTSTSAFVVEGQPEPGPGEVMQTELASISANYFAVLEIPLRAGRLFVEKDQTERPDVIVVDETFARTVFGDASPIGKRIKLSPTPSSYAPWLEIVGVVGHVKNHGVHNESRIQAYAPYWQKPTRFVTMVMRSDGSGNVENGVAEEVAQIDPGIPLFNATRLETYLRDQTFVHRLTGVLLLLFGGTGLALAIAGLYGTVVYALAQRRRELGIRLAIGATPRQVWALIVRETALLAGTGTLLGLIGAYVLSPSMAGLLFATSPHDPVAFTGVAVVLTLVTMAAAAIPARRAVHQEPVFLLRNTSPST